MPEKLAIVLLTLQAVLLFALFCAHVFFYLRRRKHARIIRELLEVAEEHRGQARRYEERHAG